MEMPLKVLLLEDNPSDARLVIREMSRAGFDAAFTQVETAEEYAAHLNDGIDLILADFSLPSFSAPLALAMLREREIDIPFIVVTGKATEEEVVECMRGGAADYLLKDRLARLGQAVLAALAAREVRADSQRASKAILRRDAILEAVSQAIFGLLSAPDWKAGLNTELARLGAAADVETVSVLRLVAPGEAGRHQGVAEILTQGRTGAIDEISLDGAAPHYTESAQAWQSLLASGMAQAILVSDLPSSEQLYFDRVGIVSVLVAPVIARGELWGALAFGERTFSRDWAAPEIGALETAARILGAVVHRERTSLALRQNEETTRAILRSIPDLILRVDPSGTVLGHQSGDGSTPYIDVNPYAGQTLDGLFPVESTGFESIVGTVLRTGTPYIAEHVEMTGEAGSFHELRIVRAGESEALVIARDVTERFRSEQRTRALNAATQVLAQTGRVSDMVSEMLAVLGGELGWDVATYWAVDTDRDALTFVEMWHRDPEHTAAFEAAARNLSIVQGMGLAGLVWQRVEPAWFEDLAREPSFIQQREAANAGIESALAFPVYAGDVVFGIIKLLCVGQREQDPNLMKAAQSLGIQIGQFIDRRQRERRISETEMRFRTMADMAPVLMWVSDSNGDCTFVNRPWVEFMGIPAAQALQSGWMDVIHPEDRARAVTGYRSGFDDREGYQIEYRVRRHDGEYRWVVTSGVPRFDADGDFVGFIGSAIDITDKMLVEAELRRERQFVQTLLDTIDVGIVACNAEGELTLLNRATQEFLGVTDGFVTQEDWAEAEKLYEPNTNTPLGRDMHPLMRALRGENVRNVEVSILSDPHKPRILLASGQCILNREGVTTGAVVAFQDVTSERLLADQFRQAHKMEAVGRLAGGVAHDFNNILTVITGYGEMLRLRLTGSEQLLQFTDEMLAASTRAASLTRQLLAFSRKQLLQPRALELNNLVKNLHQMLARLIGEDIELKIKLDPDVGNIFADPGQIEQVVINLVVNARDAMPEGGTLSIETSTVDLDRAAFEGFGDVQPGLFHMVTVTDTGCGMSPETMSHIYEPFFTTKAADRGTGLGLATVYGIVRQSNGAVFAVSEPGEGSVFKICLPVHAGSAPDLEAVNHSVEATAHGETVLVVEDDPAVRKLVCGALTDAGYRIVEAQNGEEALAFCESHTGPLDLVLTDMVMPKLGGRLLALQIAEMRPTLPVLFMSGYTHDSFSAEERSSSEIFVLEKPFSRFDLTRAVRRAMHGTAEPNPA